MKTSCVLALPRGFSFLDTKFLRFSGNQVSDFSSEVSCCSPLALGWPCCPPLGWGMSIPTPIPRLLGSSPTPLPEFSVSIRPLGCSVPDRAFLSWSRGRSASYLISATTVSVCGQGPHLTHVPPGRVDTGRVALVDEPHSSWRLASASLAWHSWAGCRVSDSGEECGWPFSLVPGR